MTPLEQELWLARRLREHGAAVFEGVTDRNTRREQVAVLLTQAGQQRHFHACDWSFAGYFPHRCPARQEAA